MHADKLGPVVCCVCLFTSCVLVSLSNDLAVCTVSELLVHSDLSAMRLLLVCGSCPTFPVEDIIVKFMPHTLCLQIGLTWRHNQPTERAVDNGHIDSVIICWLDRPINVFYTVIVEWKLCKLSSPDTVQHWTQITVSPDTKGQRNKPSWRKALTFHMVHKWGCGHI